MKYFFVAAFFLLSSLSLPAQTQIPAGTILPAQLASTIDSRKAHPGELISARLMQEVDLGGGRKFPSGTRVVGKILAVSPTQLTLTFDKIDLHHRTLPIRTDLRSLASMMEVVNAELPTNDVGGDFGSSLADWNTVQIGGQVVYGRDGVYSGGRVVGRSLMSGGILAIPEAAPSSKCRGELGSSALQSFWIFSTSACGVYGFEDLSIRHAGRTDPVGQVVLTSSRHILIRSGSGLLLRVIGDQ